MGRSKRPKNAPSEFIRTLDQEAHPQWAQFWLGERGEEETTPELRWSFGAPEKLPGGKMIVSGPGPDGSSVVLLGSKQVFLLSGESAYLSHQPGLFFKDEERHVFLSQEGDEVCASIVTSGERPLTLSPLLLNGNLVAASPGEVEAEARIFYENEDGLFYRDFQDNFLLDTGEYQLARGPGWRCAARIEHLGSSGILFQSSGGRSLYLYPDGAKEELPLSGKVVISGDPWDPFIVSASQNKITLFPERREVFSEQEIKDIDAIKEGKRKLAIWIEDGALKTSRGTSIKVQGSICKALPRKEALVAGKDGLFLVSLESEEVRLLFEEPVLSLEVVLYDESESEIILTSPSGSYLLKGEI